MQMYLYDALGYINNGLGFEHNKLFNYIIWTSYGEESFLRTQAVTRQEPLKDRIVECKWVMAAFQEPVENANFDYKLDKPTPTKLQVYFLNNALEVQQYKEINANLGFPYVYTCLTDWSKYKENKNSKKSKS